MKNILIGMDISKHSFEVFGRDETGSAVIRKRLYRSEVLNFYANLKPCKIGIEACGGAHYWARELMAFGHEVRLISPQFVKPYVKSNKNDRADAEAICEAVSRPGMRFVGIKSVSQQDVLSLHRVRERLVKSRTALANEIRGLLSEYGVIVPQGISRIRVGFSEILETNQAKLTAMARETFADLLQEFHQIDEHIDRYEKKIKQIHLTNPISKQLATIPGVGEIIATAVIASVGDPTVFKNGRQFAAWLGLVPRQHSTGGKERLLGISKRGDTYLRKQLIHGARSVMVQLGKHGDRRSTWAKKLKERRGVNRTTVAVANKNARVMWAILTKGTRYFEQYEAIAA